MSAETLLYGANGYTARLIIDHARQAGVPLVLAGRDAAAIRAQAEREGWDVRIFDLTDSRLIAEQLAGIKVVINAAGPFVHTAEPLARACLQAGVHYLDITAKSPCLRHWRPWMSRRVRRA